MDEEDINFILGEGAVETYQVPRDDMESIANWCGGTICETDGVTPGGLVIPQSRCFYIKINKDTLAFETDWIVKRNGEFRVFKDGAYREIQRIGANRLERFDRIQALVVEAMMSVLTGEVIKDFDIIADAAEHTTRKIIESLW